MNDQDRQLDAAEYVIGTLSPVERTAFEISIAEDETTRRHVTFWERSFGALNASIAPHAPPKDMWPRIDAALSSDGVAPSALPISMSDTAPASANDNALSALKRSRGRWRMGALAATVAALALGAYTLSQQPGLPFNQADQGNPMAGNFEGRSFVAVVNANGDQPSLVVSIDAKTGLVSVRSLGVERPDDKDLQLWYVADGGKPVSVGLIGQSKFELDALEAKPGDLIAVSVEPKGGSTTGSASGPVIYSGKLVETPTN